MLWLNGALRPAAEAAIRPDDRGFLLADGLFETIRVTEGRPAWLSRHLARLREGCAVLDLALPWSDTDLATAMGEVIAAQPAPPGSLRLTLTRGPAPRGLLPPAEPVPTLLIAAHPPALALPPARLIVARGTRRNAQSPLSRIKSLSYGDGILARQEAARRGADDAILLNTEGRLAEATAATLFLLYDGRWLTPPVTEGALPGITRALLLEGGFAAESVLSEDDLAAAEAALLANSLDTRVVATIEARSLCIDNAAQERAQALSSDFSWS